MGGHRNAQEVLAFHGSHQGSPGVLGTHRTPLGVHRKPFGIHGIPLRIHRKLLGPYRLPISGSYSLVNRFAIGLMKIMIKSCDSLQIYLKFTQMRSYFQ